MNRTKPLQSHPERFSSFVIDETLGCDLEESIVTPRHDADHNDCVFLQGHPGDMEREMKKEG
jgi:hypothetical protein